MPYVWRRDRVYRPPTYHVLQSRGGAEYFVDNTGGGVGAEAHFGEVGAHGGEAARGEAIAHGANGWWAPVPAGDAQPRGRGVQIEEERRHICFEAPSGQGPSHFPARGRQAVVCQHAVEHG